jgi:gamma-glutamyltranspeptidase
MPASNEEVPVKASNRCIRVSAGSIVATVAVAAAIALTPAEAAGVGGRTFMVATTKQQGSVWIAGGGKAMRPGRLSAGNRLFETNAVRRDDGTKGVFIASVTIASPGTVAASSAVGLIRGVYRFADGDVYVEGLVSFAGPSGSGVIVGGTGAYAAVRGTFTSTEAKDVLRLRS